MNTQRYDIYALIHKGLRSCLTDTLIAMGRVDLHSTAELDAALEQVKNLLAICQGHLEHEDTFIHQAMEACEPGVAADMYHHHKQHEAMISELQSLVEKLAQCPVQERAQVAATLYRRLAVFVADNLAHMHEEETANNAILWRNYSDAEIQEIEHRLVQSITPEENALVMRWMLPALNHQEREGFLNNMRKAAPPPVFEGVMHIARLNLPAVEWNKLEMALAG